MRDDTDWRFIEMEGKDGRLALPAVHDKTDLGIACSDQPGEILVDDRVPDHDSRQHGWTLPGRIGAAVRSFEKQLVSYNLEARGIQRVEESERIQLSWLPYLQSFLLWVSINLAANNITLGMLGPAVYYLSFLDSALCAVLGALVGSLVASWCATWGPVSGNRTMVGSPKCLLNQARRRWSNVNAGVWEIFHGLVAKQDCGLTESHSNDWILYDRLRGWRTDPICSFAWRQHVGCCW